jgi:hypothetical protein
MSQLDGFSLLCGSEYRKAKITFKKRRKKTISCFEELEVLP